MTKLTKRVTRETLATYRSRAIIVTLRPPDLLVFRIKKTRREYPLSIPAAFMLAAKCEAIAEMKQKKAERKAKRIARKLYR